ncbi:MAG: molybdenum cofactor biosynthesis protein MoaE [marine benthic group bacterium]|nr:molybdenum cofactor biosynthesis protein MoaE [Gemmatimonadota bacterium]
MTVPGSARGSESPGGVLVAEVTRDELDGADLLRRLGTRSDGAVLVFEGRVRDHNAGREVVALHYDAYREMADDVLREIASEALQESGASAIGVRHRVGSLVPPAVSLVVAVAAAHRRPAYEASSYVIEELKRRLPLWKREEYADGTHRWLGGQTPPVGHPDPAHPAGRDLG